MLLNLVRPTTVTIFASDPVNQGKALAFLISRVSGIVPAVTDLANVAGKTKQVDMHLVKSMQSSMSFSATRNPIEKFYADNLIPEPERLMIQATLSANALGYQGLLGAATGLSGVVGSVIRLDLEALSTLRSLAKAREPLIVVTPVRTYVDMALTSIAETHMGPNKVDVQLSFETLEILEMIPKPSVFDAADVGTYTIENLGAQFPKGI
jgi:hypothetical protein